MGRIFPRYTQLPSELNQRLLDFLPDRLFDAHVHVTEDSGFAEYTQAIYSELPGIREARAMLIPLPTKSMCRAGSQERQCANERIKKQLDSIHGTVGEVFVMPGDSCDDIFSMTDNPLIRGIKCYFYSAGKANPAIAEYLPESAWQAAAEKDLAITLHLARPSSLSDPEDLSYIQRMTRKYPYAKLILAHCGRAFAAWTCQEPVKQLQGIDNIFYDLSAICEPAPMYYCLKYAGCDHVLWGTDFPISNFRGRAVSAGSGFVWMAESAIESSGSTAPVMNVMQENLLAVYTAADMLELPASDIFNIFYQNMEDLFG